MSADVIPFTSPTRSEETNRGFKSYKCSRSIEYTRRCCRDAMIQATLDPDVGQLFQSELPVSTPFDTFFTFCVRIGDRNCVIALCDETNGTIFSVPSGFSIGLSVNRDSILAEPVLTTSRTVWSRREILVPPAFSVRLLKHLARVQNGVPLGGLEDEFADEQHRWVDFIMAMACGGLVSIDCRQAARAIPRQGLHDYLDISRAHLNHLLNAGYIKPIVEADDLDALFDPQDLDAFLANLKDNAEIVTEPTPDQMPMIEAVKRACCGVPEVLSLLLATKLDWVGMLKGERGYNAILVSLSEVKAKTELPPLDGITVDAITDDFGISERAAKQLIQIGALPIVTATNPKNRCPVKIVPNDEYRRFKHRYVSLRDLSRDSGRWPRHIPPELAARGIYPIPELREVDAYIFLREQLT